MPYTTIPELSDAVDEITTELGVNPSGVYTTVRSRLDILENRIGSGSGGGSFTPGLDLDGSNISQKVIGLQSHPLPIPSGTNTTIIWDGSTLSWGTVNSFTASNDLSGSSNSQTVIGLRNNPLPAPSGINTILTWSGSTLSWSSPPSGFTAGGDLLGSSTSQQVISLSNGKTLPVSFGSVGNVLQINGASSFSYGPINLAGGSNFISGILPNSNQQSQTLGNNLSGTTSNAVVVSINSAAVPVAGSLTTGNLLQVSGTSTLSYAPLNLAGGVNFLTGVLPRGNQQAQSLAGDATGDTSAVVNSKINGTTVPAGGALTTGQILRVSGASAMTYGALDLANTNAVTGALPAGNQSAQTLSGNVTGTTAANTVVSINSATVPAAGSLVTGTILRVTGASALAYGALDLANTNAVTGILATSNQASQTMLGDVTGTTAASIVSKVNGSTVPVGGSLVTGTVLRVTGASSLAYGAVDLANTSAVTGTLPTTNQASQTMAGDVTGTTAVNTVVKVNGATVPTGSGLTIGNVLKVATATTLTYNAINLAGGSGHVTGVLPIANQASQTMTGDVTGTTAASVVAKANGATIPAAGSLTTGNTLQVSGASTLSYAALNLAGGSNFVTGSLPTANQVAQSMGGDASGTTASTTIIKINGSSVPVGGALTTGNILQVTGISALSYAPLNLAGGANFVTGSLPAANQVSQTMAGDVTGTTAVSVVAKANGATLPAGTGLTTGNTLQVSGTSTLSYAALNLAGGANFVTGTLPTANQASQTMVGDVTGTTSASVVAKINGSTVPAGGSISTGAVLRATGTSTLAYGPVDLASTNAVTGLLPSANQGAQTLTGDVTGNTGASVTSKLNGATVTAAGALTTGNVLQVSGVSALSYGALNLAGGANFVTGSLPTANQVAQSISGDGSGTTAALVVTGLRGNSVPSPTGTNTVLNWSGTVFSWAANQSFNAGGDLSGNSTTQQVIAVNGTTVPATPSANTTLIASSGTVATWSLISNASISSSAAIAGTKIAPAFGTQDVSNTGTLSTGSTTGTNIILGANRFTTKTITGNATVDTTTSDMIILCNLSGAATLTLVAPVNGRIIFLKDIGGNFGTNNLTIAQSSTETIDGLATSKVFQTDFGSLTLVGDGTSWWVL